MDPALPPVLSPRPVHPYSGWALDVALSLDDVVPSFVARSFRWGPLKRQAVYYVMAQIHGGVPIAEVALRFAHLGLFTCDRPYTRVGTMLDSLRARDIMVAMIGEVPPGLLGTMERLGHEPMSDPVWYQTLVYLYRLQTPEGRRRTKVLSQIGGKLKGSQIEAVSLLDPVLLHPHILARATNGTESMKLNVAVAYVRSRCSAATDVALR